MALTKLDPVKTVDPSQVVGSYFAAKGAKEKSEMGKSIFKGKMREQENVFADRKRKIEQEGEDRAYLKRRRLIEKDEDIQKQYKNLIAQVDPDADDEIFQEQVSAIPDAMASRMEALGFEGPEIKRSVSDYFRSGALSRSNVKRVHKQLGISPEKTGTTATMKDLETILGRKPTMEEYKDFKKTSGKTGEAPADAKMVEYLVSNKIAPDRKAAYSMVQMSKSDPVKLVNDMVMAAEKAQQSASLLPGDEGYKDRETLIREAQQRVMDIRSAFSGQPEPVAQEPAPQHTPGAGDPMMSRTPGLPEQPAAPAAGQQVTREMAAQLLEQAGGDINAAREAATQLGLTF